MIILPHREKFINKHFFELSFKEEDTVPDLKLFKTLNAYEQFYLAETYNWDDGTEVLKWIIESPICDKGTASLIFWSAEPDFYFDYTEKTIVDYEKGTFDLLQKIIKKFRNSEFNRSKIKFDPTLHGNKTDWKTELDIWEIPDELRKPTKGSELISLSNIKMKISHWCYVRKSKKRERRKAKRKNAT